MVQSIEVQRFTTIFKCKSNTYVRNELSKEKPIAGVKNKTIITNRTGKVDAELLTHHLNGDFGVGVCPVNAEGKCYFGVLDIDYYKPEISRVLEIIKEYQLPLLPFRSKSGGLHVYLMVDKAISAKTMRDTLNKISNIFALDSIYGKGKVEVFPKQDKAEGFGSSVTLPYFNCEDPYTYLLDLDGNKVDFVDALFYIQKHLTTIADVKKTLEALPYSDAPPCLQKILLSGAVGEDDTGRNNFLMSFGVYAKKKYGDGFDSYVEDINDSFALPLEGSVLTGLIKSVRENEYSYKCKDIPCNGFCDKGECKKREYGLGRAKGHFTNIDYGQIFRYKTAEPYYIWKLRLVGQEKWVDVVFKDEGFLLEQKNFAKMCMRFLNQAPMQVSNNDWYSVLNSVMPHIKDVEVKQESDTSGLSLVRNTFIRYLSNKQARRDSPYQIMVGLCVRQTKKDDTGKVIATYYFTHTGFEEYLRNNKIVFDMTMLRETLKGFGAKEDVLRYSTMLGEEREFACWSKIGDETIDDAYEGSMDVEAGDKALVGTLSVSDVEEESDADKNDEKPYTEEDLKNVEEMF